MHYTASITARRFHTADLLVRILCGPVQSGKTTACVADLLLRAAKVEQSEIAVISASAAATALAISDFFSVVPQSITTAVKNTVAFTFNDTSRVKLHFVNTAKELATLKLSGAWVTNARDVDHSMVMTTIGRVGLFDTGVKPFIIMDTRPPSTSSWIYACCEDLQLADWRIFKQPSGLSPEAENLANLPEGYYQRLCAGRPQEWIDVYVHGKYGLADEAMIDYSAVYTDLNANLLSVNLDSMELNAL